MLAGLVAARCAHYVALALVVGAAGFATIAPPSESNRAGAHASQLTGWRQRLLAWASVGVLASALAVLGMTAANLTGEPVDAVDVDTLWTVVAETDFGRIWGVRLLLAAGLVAVAIAPWPPRTARRRQRIAWLLAGALLATIALTGHAQTLDGLAGLVHRASDAAHLIAAGVWLGALPPFLYLLRRSSGVGDAGSVGEAARQLRRFHNVGTVAVATLVATGLVSSWVLVADPVRLATTAYGQVLLVKLALFAAMLVLAADNRLRLVPQLDRALAQGLATRVWIGRLRGHIRAEFALGIGVLLAVGLLGTLAPAAHAT